METAADKEARVVPVRFGCAIRSGPQMAYARVANLLVAQGGCLLRHIGSTPAALLEACGCCTGGKIRIHALVPVIRRLVAEIRVLWAPAGGEIVFEEANVLSF